MMTTETNCKANTTSKSINHNNNVDDVDDDCSMGIYYYYYYIGWFRFSYIFLQYYSASFSMRAKLISNIVAER